VLPSTHQGQRAPGLRFGDLAPWPARSVASFTHVFAGLTNKPAIAHGALWHPAYSSAQATYDLRRCASRAFIERVPGTNLPRDQPRRAHRHFFTHLAARVVVPASPTSPNSPVPSHQHLAADHSLAQLRTRTGFLDQMRPTCRLTQNLPQRQEGFSLAQLVTPALFLSLGAVTSSTAYADATAVPVFPPTASGPLSRGRRSNGCTVYTGRSFPEQGSGGSSDCSDAGGAYVVLPSPDITSTESGVALLRWPRSTLHRYG